MIEEIYKKIKHFEEDELTGDFFGTIKYIPFQKGFGRILNEFLKEKEDQKFKKAKEILETFGTNVEFIFWNKQNGKRKYTKGEDVTEPDVLIVDENENAILIEVKYISGPSDGGTEEKKQINREKNFLNSNFQGKNTLFLYIGDIWQCTKIERSEEIENIITITWSDITEILKNILNPNDIEDNYIKFIFEDILSFLRVKGFEKFKGFRTEIEDMNVYDNYFYQYGEEK